MPGACAAERHSRRAGSPEVGFKNVARVGGGRVAVEQLNNTISVLAAQRLAGSEFLEWGQGGKGQGGCGAAERHHRRAGSPEVGGSRV